MSNWNHDQSRNNGCQGCNNFYYPLPLFSENGVDPRGFNRPFNRPPAPRPPPPPPSVPPHGMRLPPGGCFPEPPPFFRHFPPPPFPPPPFPPLPPDRYRNPCLTSPLGPFSRPPPQNIRPSLPENPRHFQGFAPNQPSQKYPALNLPPPNCPRPGHRLPNCPRPPARFDYPRPINTFHQRPPGGLPVGGQQIDFPLKRPLNAGYNGGKVHVLIT